MIHGLVVDINGKELREVYQRRVDHYAERISTLKQHRKAVENAPLTSQSIPIPSVELKYLDEEIQGNRRYLEHCESMRLLLKEEEIYRLNEREFLDARIGSFWSPR
jgi:hypothetical protein